MVKSLTLLASNLRGSSVGIEENIIDNPSLLTFDTTHTSIVCPNIVVQPPMDDDNGIPLRWDMQRERESNKKEKADEPNESGQVLYH